LIDYKHSKEAEAVSCSALEEGRRRLVRREQSDREDIDIHTVDGS
jgi:hypothetical protein